MQRDFRDNAKEKHEKSFRMALFTRKQKSQGPMALRISYFKYRDFGLGTRALWIRRLRMSLRSR